MDGTIVMPSRARANSFRPRASHLFPPRYNFLRLDYWFGQVDSRPLSLFRIAFAALLFKNALYCIPIAHLFYSDDGIVPRPQFWDNPMRVGLGRFSVMNFFAESWLAILFFLVWAGITLALLVGYRTRLLAVLNFLCQLSIVNRNPFILTGADIVMTALSFWMIFLPLSQHYAVDAWLARRRRVFTERAFPSRQGQKAFSSSEHLARPFPESVAGSSAYAFPLRVIQIQVAIIYIFTSYYKWQGALWHEGDALFYTFQQVGYLLPTGIWVSQVAPLWLLRLSTWATLLIEAAFAPLVFLPIRQPWARACGLLLVTLLHVGIAVTMDVPDFSIVMWISYLLFFDPSWVDWLEQKARRLLKRPPADAAPLPAAPQPAGGWLRMPLTQWGLTLLLTMLLGTAIWGGIGRKPSVWHRFDTPRPLLVRVINYQLRLGGGWQMFTYSAIPRVVGILIQGQFEDGVQALLHTSADPQTGQMYRQWGPFARLRLLEQHLSTSFPDTILRAWGSYYCKFYNGAQGRAVGQRLTTLEIHLRYRRTHLPNKPPNPYEDDLLWRHQCF